MLSNLRDQVAAAALDFNELQHFYKVYTEKVSNAGMAASWELISLLPGILLKGDFRVCVDLGSGFTSFVLRYVQAKTAGKWCTISVDDNEGWLRKTRLYIEQAGLASDDLLMIDEFLAQNGRIIIDLLICDYSGFRERASLIQKLTPFVHKGSIILFDDFHQREDTLEYQNAVEDWCEETGFRLVSLRNLTADQFGRFAVLAYHHSSNPFQRFV
jgi:hypothetical protein